MTKPALLRRRFLLGRWFRKWRVAMGCRRSSYSVGAGKRGNLRLRVATRQRRFLCPRSWKRHRRQAHRAVRQARGSRADLSGIIEVEIDGVTVRIGRGAEAKTVAAVLHALKASA